MLLCVICDKDAFATQLPASPLIVQGVKYSSAKLQIRV